MHRDELENHLNQLLDIPRFHDYCPNGLQVEGRGNILTLISGVTASLDLLQAAVAAKADAVLVHHGYFWRGEDTRITGMKARRVALLMQQQINWSTEKMHPIFLLNTQGIFSGMKLFRLSAKCIRR